MGWLSMGNEQKPLDPKGRNFKFQSNRRLTRLLGNLGWALMQQNNYIEAEDAYRRALVIAPDNNKVCNLGICLMKQRRLGEAKDTLRLVKPAVVDGPRGVDSHLKAYERAQQMLSDLESYTMNSGGDRFEQRKLFVAFLGSSALWQPQPCPPNPRKTPQDRYGDENANSNIIEANGNSLNIEGRDLFPLICLLLGQRKHPDSIRSF